MLAAFTTCSKAFARLFVSSIASFPPGSSNLGNSSTGSVLKLNSDFPLFICISSSLTTNEICPFSKTLIMSANKAPGITTLPSSSQPTFISIRIVRSKSLPITTSLSFFNSKKRPDKTGFVPLLLGVAFLASENVFSKISFSHLNFIYNFFVFLKLSRCNRSCELWIKVYFRRSVLVLKATVNTQVSTEKNLFLLVCGKLFIVS